MEVLALHVRVTEADLAALLDRLDREFDHPLEDVRLELTPAGMRFSGAYPLFLRVKFETTWALSVRDGKLLARLVDTRAMGVPAAIFRSAVMKLIEGVVANEPGVSYADDALVLDLDRALSARLFPITVNLQDVRIEQGALILSAGPAKMGA